MPGGKIKDKRKGKVTEVRRKGKRVQRRRSGREEKCLQYKIKNYNQEEEEEEEEEEEIMVLSTYRYENKRP